MNNIRPVHIIAPGIIAGAEKVVISGVASLAERGLNPMVVIIKETRAPEYSATFNKMLAPNIERKIIETDRAIDLLLPFKLYEALIFENQRLILHTHGFKALIACVLISKKHPHFHTHHGNTSHTLKVKVYEWIAFEAMKRCDAIIAVSCMMKSELDYRLKCSHKIKVVENVLSINKINQIIDDHTKLDLAPSNKIKLIFIGRLSPEKGLIIFLENFIHYSKSHYFQIDILGDGPEKEKISTLIKNHQMNSSITLHGFQKDPTPLLSLADILIMPSLREGMPMTVIESKALGIPVIANNVGAISEMVIHEHNGYITSDLTKESWDKALNSALCNLSEWKKNANLEVSDFHMRFSPKKWASNTIKIYESQFSKIDW